MICAISLWLRNRDREVSVAQLIGHRFQIANLDGTSSLEPQINNLHNLDLTNGPDGCILFLLRLSGGFSK